MLCEWQTTFGKVNIWNFVILTNNSCLWAKKTLYVNLKFKFPNKRHINYIYIYYYSWIFPKKQFIPFLWEMPRRIHLWRKPTFPDYVEDKKDKRRGDKRSSHIRIKLTSIIGNIIQPGTTLSSLYVLLHLLLITAL